MPQPGALADALIVFADIVDSSKYSAILGYREYAKRLLHFQDTFKSLGHRYFPEPLDKALEFCNVDARGDEGVVFAVCPSHERAARQAFLVFRAITFLYHLKGRLRLGTDRGTVDPAPHKFDIGAGIHWGPIVLTLPTAGARSPIIGVEGYAINYAKRVESCSREGLHSRILLSSEAAKSLEFEPIVLSRMRVSMKGIGNDIELAEVQGGLFDGIELSPTDPADEDLVRQIEYLSDHPMEIEAPWVKAFAVSVLEQACRNTQVQAEKERYRQKQYALAWHSPKEDDPILLYLRSRECRESGQRTRELRYLRGLLEKHPDFLHARLLLAKSCWALAKTKAEREEKLLARDTAKEFLEHYRHFLSDQERKEFKRLVQDLKPARKSSASRKRRSKGG